MLPRVGLSGRARGGAPNNRGIEFVHALTRPIGNRSNCSRQLLDQTRSVYFRGANVLCCNHDIVEVDDIHLLLGPAVRDAAFRREGIG